MHLLIGKIAMGQKITISISGKKYELSANSPEDEEIYRLAAASVNKMLSIYTDKYPGKELAELLSFVALTESRGRLSLMEKRLNCTQEILSELLRQQKDSSLQGMILQSVLYVFRFRRTLLRDTQQRML